MTEEQIKRMLLKNLEEKQVKAFEQKQRGERATVRRYVQITESIEQLKQKPKGRRTAKKTA